MQTLLLSMLLVPAAPVPKVSDPDREATWKILLECSKSENGFTRARTVKSMVRLKHKDFIPKLKEFCADPDAKVRFEALMAMIEFNAVDNTGLATLRQLAQEVKANREILQGEYDFNHIIVAVGMKPRACELLVPFLREEYEGQTPGQRSCFLTQAWAPHALHEPGALDKALKQLRTWNPAKAGELEDESVWLFALGLRTLDFPPKEALEELERWLVPGFYWPTIARVETLLKFDPKNRKARETLMLSCRTFDPRSPVQCWCRRDSLKLAIHDPESFANMVEYAFDPQLFDAERGQVFVYLGRQGKLSHPYLDALERNTKTDKPLLKYSSIEALVRLKPETREKFVPVLFDAIEEWEALRSLVALKVRTKESIAALEKIMLGEPVNSDRSLQFATALASIDPDNPALLKWTEERIKAYDWNVKQPIELLKKLGYRARKMAPAIIEWMKSGEEYYPNPDIVEAIEAITR